MVQRVAWWLVVASGALSGPGPFHAQAAVQPAQDPGRDPSEAFFNEPIVRTFKIQVSEPALTALRKNPRTYVRATVQEGDCIFKDVALRLKGMGSFRPLDQKPSFTLKFDHFTPDQNCFGLTKLMLNNSSQDSTYLAEWLATHMFREAGVPSPRVTHAFVEFNGRALGLYVVVEAMNKRFLRRFFANPNGNLYEGYCQDIDQRLDQDHGTDTSQADRLALVAAAQIAEPARRWERLNQVLDVDRYVSHLVIELFTSHTDGYALNRNNYRIYHDPGSDRFVFFGHGIDWAFANTGVAIEPPLASLVTRAVLSTTQGRRLFQQRRAELFERLFRLEILTNRVAQAVAKLKAAARSPAEANQVEACGQTMIQRLIARHRNVAEQLARLQPKPLPFDAQGVARLTDWQPRKLGGERFKAEGALDKTMFEGRPCLHLRANAGDGLFSWRTKVFLEPGRYRFEGLARTLGVVGLTNAVQRGNGAGLRVSGQARTHQLLGESAWTRLAQEFTVPSGGAQTELLCELRASQGEAWFDLESLRLVRLP